MIMTSTIKLVKRREISLKHGSNRGPFPFHLNGHVIFPASALILIIQLKGVKVDINIFIRKKSLFCAPFFCSVSGVSGKGLRGTQRVDTG